MKKYLSLIAFMFMAVGLSAQETETLPEEGEVIVEKREEFTIPNRSQRENKSKLDISFNPMLTSRFKRSAAARQGWHKGHWAGVSIYYNGLIDNLGALSTPSESARSSRTEGPIRQNSSQRDPLSSRGSILRRRGCGSLAFFSSCFRQA